MVPEMKNYDYANRLKKLALPSLSYRRKRGDMIEVYKYTHGLYKVSALPVEMEEKTTRGHNNKLKKKRCSTTRVGVDYKSLITITVPIKLSITITVVIEKAITITIIRLRLQLLVYHGNDSRLFIRHVHLQYYHA